MKGHACAALAVAVAAAVSGPAFAQTLGQAPPDGFPWLRWTLAVALCLLLAVGGAYAMRARLQGRSPGLDLRAVSDWFGARGVATHRLAVIEVARVTPALQVCLLRCDTQEYLLAATPQGAVLLTPPPPGADPGVRP